MNVRRLKVYSKTVMEKRRNTGTWVWVLAACIAQLLLHTAVWGQSASSGMPSSNYQNNPRYSANTNDLLNLQLQNSAKQEELSRELAKKNTEARVWLEYYLTLMEQKELPQLTISPTSHTTAITADSVMNRLRQDFKGTFEYHYVSYLHSGRRPDAFPHLDSALKLNPGYQTLNRDLVDYYELSGNQKLRNKYLLRMKAEGEIPEAVKNYNYNVLRSVEDTCVLFTYGQSDTYPLWLLQSDENVRPHVVIMNINLLANKGYRERMMAVAGIRGNPFKTSSEKNEVWIKEMLERNPHISFYFALTVPPSLLDDWQQQLYITGLAFRYSTESFNNLSVLADNWENHFHFPGDHSKPYEIEPAYAPTSNTVFTRGRSVSVGTPSLQAPQTRRDLNSNYLLPALMLYQYYREQKIVDFAKLSSLEEFISKLTLLPQEKKVAEKYMKK